MVSGGSDHVTHMLQHTMPGPFTKPRELEVCDVVLGSQCRRHEVRCGVHGEAPGPPVYTNHITVVDPGRRKAAHSRKELSTGMALASLHIWPSCSQP